MPALIKRISNLRLEGPIIDIFIYPPAPVINDFTAKGGVIPSKKGIGLIDTGASNSCIDIKIVSEIGLISRDFISCLTPSGMSDHYTYDAGIMLPAQLGYKMFFIEVVGSDLDKQPFDVWRITL
jgi:hypothetical protein